MSLGVCLNNFLKSEIENFLFFLEHNLGRGEATIKTYRPALIEAMDSVVVDGNIVDLYDYREKIADNNPKTIAKKLSAIRSYFEWIKEKGYQFHIRGLESVKTPKNLPKPVSHKHIVEAIENSNDELALWLIYGLGLRISEASNLRLDQISANWVTVVGKGNKTRQIPVVSKLKTMIDKHILHTNPKVYLFEKDGKRLSENQLRYKITTSFQRIGLKATPHQLRHAFATEMLNAGARITDISQLLGHAQLGTTEIYTKLSSSKKLSSYLEAHPLCKVSDRD